MTELADIYLSLKDFAEPVLARFAGLDELEYLFYRYGWQISLDDPTFNKIDQALAFKAPLQQFIQTAEGLQQKLNASADATPSAQDVASLVASAALLVDALSKFKLSDLTGLAHPLGDPAFWENIGEQLLDDLLEEYLRIYQPTIYLVLHFWGAIRYEQTQPADAFRRPYTKIVFDWNQVVAMLHDPLTALKQYYRWGDPTEPFEYQKLFEALTEVLRAIQLPANGFAPSLESAAAFPGDSGIQVQSDVDALRVLLLKSFAVTNSVLYEIGIELLPAARAGQTVPSGLILGPMLRGGAEGDLPLGDSVALRWKVAVSADDIIGLALFPDKVDLTQGQLAAGASLEIAGTGTDPYYLLGNARSSRVEIYSPSLRIAIEGTAADPEAKLDLSATGPNSQPGCKVVVQLDDADGFVKDTVKQQGLELSFSPEVIWSTKTGLTFNGKANLNLDIPTSLSIGSVRVQHIVLRLAPKDDGSDAVFEFEASAGIAAALGPVQASLDRIGLLLTADFTKQDKNLGFVDLSFDFKPPSGVGLAINAAGVTGGGFLEHDGADGRYAGAIQLAFADLDLSAYGLIATKLPSGAAGFSALVVISTEFSPGIELPFGFTLDGVGGILGLNRTLALDTVEAALWAHRLDNLLFPANPIAAAPALLTSLDSFFPAARGRYLFGPLAKIGWGSIADAVIGLMIELPEPLRLLLLGEIAVLVPREHPQLELHIDFAGGYDMGKQQAFFDASLHNSRIERYPIVGDLAFRYDWGSAPVLALAIGGFNPHFQPPANFPSLKRVGIAIGQSSVQLHAQAYLALTSNTLQFGANLELTAGSGDFNVHGFLGFDALCQRSPLAFSFDLTAGVDLRAGSDVLASVHLDGHVSGPTPWHVAGDASLSLLFFDVSVHFDKSWGDDAAATPPIDPMPDLRAALADRSSYGSILSATTRAVVVVASSPTDAQGAVLLDPAAMLRISQRVLPLGQPITRFAGVALGKSLTLLFDGLNVMGAAVSAPTAANEEFALAQFEDLTDAEKLSMPSFTQLAGGVVIGDTAVDLGRGTRPRATMTPLSYETIIIDSQPAPPKKPGYVLPLANLLAMNCRATPAPRGISRYAPAPGSAPAVTLAAERYVIAGTDDTKVRPDIANDGTKRGALAALAAYRAKNPPDAANVQVLLEQEAA
jgi:hypothetical protein